MNQQTKNHLVALRSYSQLQQAPDALGFWQPSILLEKIVDARFALWQHSGAPSDQFKRFVPTIESRLEHRIQKWNSSRKDHLFGQKAPNPTFLVNFR